MSYHDYYATMSRLYDKAPARIRMRAKGYYSGGNLLDLKLEDGVLEAKVRGSEVEPYEVTVDLEKKTRNCTCPAHHKYRDIPCKHQVLAVLPLIGKVGGRT